jgi:restriction system protein
VESGRSRSDKGRLCDHLDVQPPGAGFCRHLSQRVILLDGQNLADLMIEHGVGVRTSRAIEFKRLDEDFFSEDD